MGIPAELGAHWLEGDPQRKRVENDFYKIGTRCWMNRQIEEPGSGEEVQGFR